MAEISRFNERSGRWERSTRKKMGDYIKTAGMRAKARNPQAF